MKKSRLTTILVFGCVCLFVGAALSFFTTQNTTPKEMAGVQKETPIEFRRFGATPPIDSPKKLAVVVPSALPIPPFAPNMHLLPPPKYSYLPLGGLFGFSSSVSGTLYKGITNARWSEENKSLSFASSNGGWSLSFQAYSPSSVRLETITGAAFATAVVEAMGKTQALYTIKKEESLGENVFIPGGNQGAERYSLVQTTETGAPIVVNFSHFSGSVVVDSNKRLRLFSLSEPVMIAADQPTTTTRLLSLEEIRAALESGAGVLVGTNINKEGNVFFDFSRFSLSSIALSYAVDTTNGVVYPAFLCNGTTSGGKDSGAATFLLRADSPLPTPEP